MNLPTSAGQLYLRTTAERIQEARVRGMFKSTKVFIAYLRANASSWLDQTNEDGINIRNVRFNDKSSLDINKSNGEIVYQWDI